MYCTVLYCTVLYCTVLLTWSWQEGRDWLHPSQLLPRAQVSPLLVLAPPLSWPPHLHHTRTCRQLDIEYNFKWTFAKFEIG